MGRERPKKRRVTVHEAYLLSIGNLRDLEWVVKFSLVLELEERAVLGLGDLRVVDQLPRRRHIALLKVFDVELLAKLRRFDVEQKLKLKSNIYNSEN